MVSRDPVVVTTARASLTVRHGSYAHRLILQARGQQRWPTKQCAGPA